MQATPYVDANKKKLRLTIFPNVLSVTFIDFFTGSIFVIPINKGIFLRFLIVRHREM